jgi:hypothetical protein
MKLSRIAIALGASTLLASSVAFAAQYLPNGTYGDSNVATFTESSSGASIEWACAGAKFDGAIRIEGGGTFDVNGFYGSSLQSESDWTPVVMSGKLIEGSCTARGACFPNTIQVTIKNEKTGGKIGSWTFQEGAAGVSNHCG